MTIGTVTCIPSARFAFARSYVDRITINDILLPKTHDGPDFEFLPSIAPDQHHFIGIAHNFWPWSSNNFTLDYIVKYAYVYFISDGSILPSPVTITFHPATPTARSSISINVFGAPGTQVDQGLPLRAVPYWLPDT